MILRVINRAFHQECSHEAEFSTLERFSNDVRPHLFGRAILKIKFSRLVKMTNEEVFGFNMFGPFRTGDISIFRQRKSTHIVSVDNIGFDFVALGLEEVTRPEDITDFIIEADDLTLARTLGRNFMFRG